MQLLAERNTTVPALCIAFIEPKPVKTSPCATILMPGELEVAVSSLTGPKYKIRRAASESQVMDIDHVIATSPKWVGILEI